MFHIKTQKGGVEYELDSTASIKVSSTGVLSGFPVETRDEVSDNFVNKGKTVTLQGVITNVKSHSASENIEPEDYINGLQFVKNDKQLVDAWYSNNLEPVTNCVITSLDITRDKKHGSSSTANSYLVGITLKEVRVAGRATATAEPSIALKDSTKSKTSSGGDAAKFVAPKQSDIIAAEISSVLGGTP